MSPKVKATIDFIIKSKSIFNGIELYPKTNFITAPATKINIKMCT